MGFMDRIMGRKSAVAAESSLPDVLAKILGMGRRSKSGANVNLDTALRVSAVFGCVRVISEGVAQVPFKLMRETKSDPRITRHPQRDPASDHPLYDLLHRRPNSWQTSFEFREQLIIHTLLAPKGAFVFKNYIDIGSQGRRIVELIILDPTRVEVMQNEDWSLSYRVRGRSGGVQNFPQESIWHVRGPSWDGFTGIDILSVAREAVGLAISTEESHANLHDKGVRPSGIYSVEGTLSGEQYKALKKWIEEEGAGADKAGTVMLLDRNAKFISQAMTGVDSQHLETRRYQVEEVCRFMRVLPLMIGHSDKTQTFASAEQMFLAHVVHTLMPWYERVQQSADVNLLTDAERAEGYYTKLFETGLLRGAMKDTAEYLYRLTMAGLMERNEGRAKLDLNPLPGLDEPLTPMNMTTDPMGAGDQSKQGA